MSTPFIRAYEFEKRYNLEGLLYRLDRANEALKDFRPETIDFAKSALETICKAVLAERGIATVNGRAVSDLDFPPLVKEALKALGCQDEKLRKHLGGLAESMAETRNRETIAGHGLEGDKAFIGKAGITLFVMTFGTIMEAIMGLLDAETPDLMTTKMTFDATQDRLVLAPLNQHMDTSATVEYSPEDGSIFINGKQLRPSEILYQFDRAAYRQGIESAEEALREMMEIQIEANLVAERFDNFFPGCYGYDPPEVTIDTIRRDGTSFIAQGSVSTSARLGASSDEDGIDVDYTSGFIAVFVLDDEPEAGIDLIELASLELEVNDWIEHEPGDDGA